MIPPTSGDSNPTIALPQSGMWVMMRLLLLLRFLLRLLLLLITLASTPILPLLLLPGTLNLH